MARMAVTNTALSNRVDALKDADEKSTPSAPTTGLENRAKLEHQEKDNLLASASES
jgi:nucleolar protein 58